MTWKVALMVLGILCLIMIVRVSMKLVFTPTRNRFWLMDRDRACSELPAGASADGKVAVVLTCYGDLDETARQAEACFREAQCPRRVRVFVVQHGGSAHLSSRSSMGRFGDSSLDFAAGNTVTEVLSSNGTFGGVLGDFNVLEAITTIAIDGKALCQWASIAHGLRVAIGEASAVDGGGGGGGARIAFLAALAPHVMPLRNWDAQCAASLSRVPNPSRTVLTYGVSAAEMNASATPSDAPTFPVVALGNGGIPVVSWNPFAIPFTNPRPCKVLSSDFLFMSVDVGREVLRFHYGGGGGDTLETLEHAPMFLSIPISAALRERGIDIFTPEAAIITATEGAVANAAIYNAFVRQTPAVLAANVKTTRAVRDALRRPEFARSEFARNVLGVDFERGVVGVAGVMGTTSDRAASDPTRIDDLIIKYGSVDDFAAALDTLRKRPSMAIVDSVELRRAAVALG